MTIDAEGRDKGKAFKLTELPCAQAEMWALGVLSAMGQSGVEVDEDMMAEGMAGLARFGISAIMKIRRDLAEPLLAEMMDCVERVPDAAKSAVVRPLNDDDIDEVTTRLTLRKEVLTLHLGFFTADAPSI